MAGLHMAPFPYPQGPSEVSPLQRAHHGPRVLSKLEVLKKEYQERTLRAKEQKLQTLPPRVCGSRARPLEEKTWASNWTVPKRTAGVDRAHPLQPVHPRWDAALHPSTIQRSKSGPSRTEQWQELEKRQRNLEAEIRRKEALLREKLRRTEEELRRIQREKEEAEQEEKRAPEVCEAKRRSRRSRLEEGDSGARKDRPLSVDQYGENRKDRPLSIDQYGENRKDRPLSIDQYGENRKDRPLSIDQYSRKDRPLSIDQYGENRKDHPLSIDQYSRKDRPLSIDQYGENRKDRLLSIDQYGKNRKDRPLSIDQYGENRKDRPLSTDQYGKNRKDCPLSIDQYGENRKDHPLSIDQYSRKDRPLSKDQYGENRKDHPLSIDQYSRKDRLLSIDKYGENRKDRPLSIDKYGENRKDRPLSIDQYGENRKDRPLSIDQYGENRKDRPLSIDQYSRKDHPLSIDQYGENRKDRPLSIDQYGENRKDRPLSIDQYGENRKDRPLSIGEAYPALQGTVIDPPGVQEGGRPSFQHSGEASLYSKGPESPEQPLVPCPLCGRHFVEQRLQKHTAVCEKAHGSRRKVFDSSKARAKGTDLEQYLLKKGRQPSPAPQVKASSWRKKHESFLRTIRQARVVQDVVVRGGRIADLPPVPPEDNPDYVACPHCSRRFSPRAAERHIPKCETIKSRPRPPPSRRR